MPDLSTDPVTNPGTSADTATLQNAVVPQCSNCLQGILVPEEVNSFVTQDPYNFLVLIANANTEVKIHVPATFFKAMQKLELWKPAIEEELQMMEGRAILDLKIWQVDFVSKYLNSIPKFQMFMKLPPELSGGEGKAMELLKMLYELMQGGRNWY
ncbi:hypothetical protein C0989_012403 [Termitomyces sp. Mn162]|nr:hypothetical protein C0989_012403 [Termitomyces sp. Mn162]